MVTKQQQLEWMALKSHFTNHHVNYVVMSTESIGLIIGSGTSDRAGLSINCHVITREEWQQERDKMSKMPDVAISNQTSATISATQVGGSEMTITAQDNSWHERGELPHVGCDCEIKHKCCSEFHRVTVAAITKEYAIVEDDSVVAREQHYNLRDVTFRPLRSEREKAIDEMSSAMRDRGHGINPVTLGELYDAGFRMVKP